MKMCFIKYYIINGILFLNYISHKHIHIHLHVYIYIYIYIYIYNIRCYYEWNCISIEIIFNIYSFLVNNALRYFCIKLNLLIYIYIYIYIYKYICQWICMEGWIIIKM